MGPTSVHTATCGAIRKISNNTCCVKIPPVRSHRTKTWRDTYDPLPKNTFLCVNRPSFRNQKLACVACLVVVFYDRYKEEYAEAIREIEAVKSEMEAVKQKASKSNPPLVPWGMSPLAVAFQPRVTSLRAAAASVLPGRFSVLARGPYRHSLP